MVCVVNLIAFFSKLKKVNNIEESRVQEPFYPLPNRNMASDTSLTPQKTNLLILKRPRSKDSSNQQEKRSKRNTTCPICEDTIKEPSKHKKGEDSIYCEGYCDAWIHRRCAGLSSTNFKTLREAGDDQTFFCLYCELQAHKAEIENLISSFTELQKQLFDLKRKLEAIQAPATEQSSRSRAPMSFTSATKVAHKLHSERANNTERKFNLVIYGIDECSQKTNRQLRMKRDLENAIEELSAADDEIEPSDVKDLYRLGKYDSKSECPRPLLIKFLRSSVVLNLLSSKYKLEAPIYIKPDLSPLERQKERLILKERRVQIDKGTERRNIKIRNNSLYIDNKLHCKVSTDGSKLEFVSSSVQPVVDVPITSN